MDNLFKKAVIVSFGVICIASVSLAGNYKPVDLDKLPGRAKSFINTHFNGVKVALARKEVDFLEVSYDVIFTDGRKVEFNHKGDWKEVDCNTQEVPSAIIPIQIAEYVAAKYPFMAIIKIERDHKNVEIELNNNIELTFNSKCQLDID